MVNYYSVIIYLNTSEGYTYLDHPLILTSCNNPNERFYEWIKKGYKVQRIYKLDWNEKEQRFERESPLREFYQTEKEIILGMELESIKKETPRIYRRH